MTREAFIKKWLGNKDYAYNEENKELMRSDLDVLMGNTLTENELLAIEEFKTDKLSAVKFLMAVSGYRVKQAKDFLELHSNKP